jgi:sucrose-6F-phosphate phosphohydrolase
MQKIFLCSDLDRTLIPNGAEYESPQARAVLFEMAARSELQLAYVSGRDEGLVREAIGEFHLPEPDFVIADVGASVYHVDGDRWDMNDAWHDEIGRDWHGHTHDGITLLLSGMHEELDLQPPEKQNQYKISYYTAPSVDARKLRETISAILDDHEISANLIWSRDEAQGRGLLDILPRSANKVKAIRFLMAAERIDEDHTVFAGDSGNDLDALTSGLKAILVKNAAADVRRSALDRLSQQGRSNRLYLAAGDFRGMNGNYAAGVLEGLVHFFPETDNWIASAMQGPF